MKKKIVFPLILSATFTLIYMANTGSAQQATPARKSPPTTADKQRTEAQSTTNKQQTEAQLLTLSIQELNVRLRMLTEELKHFKSDMAEVTALWRVMLLEQRQELLEQQLAGVRGQLSDLDAQEAAIRSRLQTLDKEYIITGSAFITQDQARQQIREQLERQLQQLATRRPGLQEQEQQLRDQLNQLKSKLNEAKREMKAIDRNRELEKEDQSGAKEQ